MISEKFQKALSEQIVKEFYSAYFYMSMASYFEVENLQGFANWMRVQAQEESCHALIFFNYLCTQGCRANLGSIPAAPADFKSPKDIFKRGLEHEKIVTASIYNLMDIAVADHDYASQRFLDWFINEQVEEENNFSTLLRKLELIKDSQEGLFMLDKELSTRVFALPAPLAPKAA